MERKASLYRRPASWCVEKYSKVHTEVRRHPLSCGVHRRGRSASILQRYTRTVTSAGTPTLAPPPRKSKPCMTTCHTIQHTASGKGSPVNARRSAQLRESRWLINGELSYPPTPHFPLRLSVGSCFGPLRVSLFFYALLSLWRTT